MCFHLFNIDAYVPAGGVLLVILAHGITDWFLWEAAFEVSGSENWKMG
jgi:hypothetical protein